MIEDFRDAVFSGEALCEVFLPQSLLIHAKPDGFDGMTILLIALDQQRQKLEFLFLFGTGNGIHERLHLGQGSVVFAPPHPKGVTLEGRRTTYKNRFTPTFREVCRRFDSVF